MKRRILASLAIPLLLAACGGAPPPPQPTTLALTIIGGPTQNPGPNGAAQPVAVRIYPLAASEGSHIVWLHVARSPAEMPVKLEISLDGRSHARVRDFEFDAAALAISSRGAKGLTVSKWPVKAVKTLSPSPRG